MDIKADSYITNIIVYRLSNLFYGIAILSSLLLMYNLSNENESKVIYISLSFVMMISLMYGRIARIVSGNNYWYHIKDNFKISQNRIELENKIYDFDKIELLKFKIGKFKNTKSFLYKHVLKDNRNMIKIKTEEDFIQIYFIIKNVTEYDKLKKIRNNLT